MCHSWFSKLNQTRHLDLDLDLWPWQRKLMGNISIFKLFIFNVQLFQTLTWVWHAALASQPQRASFKRWNCAKFLAVCVEYVTSGDRRRVYRRTKDVENNSQVHGQVVQHHIHVWNGDEVDRVRLQEVFHRCLVLAGLHHRCGNYRRARNVYLQFLHVTASQFAIIIILFVHKTVS